MDVGSYANNKCNVVITADNYEVANNNGDTIKIDVAKDVKHEGIIVYDYGAFCLKVPRNEKDLFNVSPLRNYASYCKITKIK